MIDKIIKTALSRLERELELFFSGEDKTITSAEEKLPEKLNRAIAEILSAYYEMEDNTLLQDKSARKKDGLVVKRRADRRTVLTLFGQVAFSRTYFQRRDGSYVHPADAIAGLDPYQRISGGVSQALANAARTMSYDKSSKVVTSGQVSRKTVMNVIRRSAPVYQSVERRHVPVLHVDADEDHVKLQSGRGTIVPLICVYEGIEKHGRRGVCKNIFSRASYGKRTEELWEEVLDEIERRYDLENTVIYLHGDGAPWIKKGLEWLPNSIFVLDRFHKNKALKEAVSGIERKYGGQYEYLMRRALNEGDKDFFCSIRDSLLIQWPERSDTIQTATQYLLDNFGAIHICNTDPEATRGGATEPHVSHILSSRLSSRPMGWSKKTLEKFVPVLAAGNCALERKPVEEAAAPPVVNAGKGRAKSKYSLGLVDPTRAARLPGKSGKVTPLYNALRRF